MLISLLCPNGCSTVLGKLINVPEEKIILGNSTTYGLDLLANGIPWKSGDEVLVVKGDCPANLTPWSVLQKHGVSIQMCHPSEPTISAEELDRAISPRRRLFCTGSESGASCHRRLSSTGVDLALRERYLRLSPHIHNMVEDLMRLPSVLNDS